MRARLLACVVVERWARVCAVVEASAGAKFTKVHKRVGIDRTNYPEKIET